MSKKLFYRIGEACKQLDIQPYVLRYWETEFPVLSPRKSKAGQRVYSEEELRLIQRIKQLLYEEGYTIAGAKKKLEAELAEESAGGASSAARPVATPAAAAPRGGSRRSPPPAAAEPAEPADEEPAASAAPPGSASRALDSPAFDRVETLRQGVQEAVAEAREILRLLTP